MARFRNTTSNHLALIRPAGHPDSHQVDAGGEVEVRGEVTETTHDAYIVGEGDSARAYPKALWELVSDPEASKNVAAGKKPRAIENKDGE